MDNGQLANSTLNCGCFGGDEDRSVFVARVCTYLPTSLEFQNKTKTLEISINTHSGWLLWLSVGNVHCYHDGGQRWKRE